MPKLSFCCFAWLLLWPTLASGETTPHASPIEPLQSEYMVDSWQTEQGLPDNYINAITQTPEGYLWIATFNGLARFNGVEFVVFDAANTPELPSSRIEQLHLDRQGRLWILSEYGHLSQWAEGRFKYFGREELHVWCEDSAGQIWASHSWDSTNYFHFADGVFKPASSTESLVERVGRVLDIQHCGWSVRSNRLFSVQPGNPVEVVIPDYHLQGWRLAPSSDGGLWMIANRIQKFRRGNWEDFGVIPKETDQFNDYMEDRHGQLWVGTGEGELWRISTNHVFRRFNLQNSTTMELGRAIFEDAEGNIWLGNGGEGLARLKPRTFKTYDSRDGLASDVVRSVTQDRAGNIWLATVNNVDCFHTSSSGRAEGHKTGIQLPWSVYGARNGAVWIGSYAEGLFRVLGDTGTWFREPGRQNSLGPVMNVLFEDRQGQMYLGTPDGLYGVEKDCLLKHKPPAGLNSLDVRAIAENRSGELYLGANSEGLLRKTANGWKQFTTRDGLPDNHVWALYVDPEDTLWVGTFGGGLTRFKDERFFNFSERVGGSAQGPELPGIINAILEDDSGRLWLGSNQGLFRAARNELNALAEGRKASIDFTRYDRADGMGCSQCTGDMQPAAWKARDGRLWFATMKGVTVVDPHLLPFNAQPPSVLVEAVLVDDKARPVPWNAPAAKSIAEQDTLRIAAGAHRLEFHYAGLSFTAPEKVRFRFRLENFDKDWVNAGTRRVAYYTKVPPGAYHFQVLACNNDNVWNENGASLALLIVPHFWQTSWFQALAAACTAALAFGLLKLRLRQLEHRRVLQETFARRLIESQENERKRMASELHDSLGQSLLLVKNYAVMAQRETATPEKMREQLREISTTASASIDEVRSIARALRPYQLDRFGLTKTLEDATDMLAKSASLEIKTEIENVDRLFSPEAQISIYRVVQEWLNNVMKHSKASSARLVVRKENGLVRMRMEDDGVGFDYSAVINRSGGETGFGLANLRERVRLLGGSLKIESAPGKGTRLSVDVPYEELHHSPDS